MKTLGITTPGERDNSSVISLLSHDFLFVPFDYQIKNGKVETAADAIYWDGTECPDSADLSLLKTIGVKQVGLTRLSKLEQHLIFSRLGIPCPEYYNARTSFPFQVSSLLDGIDDDTPLVVKSFYGARGLEQFLIRRGALVRSVYPGADSKAGKRQGRFLEPATPCVRKETEVDSVEEPDVVLGGDESESDYSKRFFKSRNIKDWLITRKVAVQHEYRVIAFREAGLMWCERHVNLGHFQNNLAVGTEVSYLGADDSIQVPEEVKRSAENFAHMLQKEHPTAPFFSMDVYLSDTGEVGLFEYAGEFGFAAMNFDELRKRAVSAINHLL